MTSYNILPALVGHLNPDLAPFHRSVSVFIAAVSKKSHGRGKHDRSFLYPPRWLERCLVLPPVLRSLTHTIVLLPYLPAAAVFFLRFWLALAWCCNKPTHIYLAQLAPTKWPPPMALRNRLRGMPTYIHAYMFSAAAVAGALAWTGVADEALAGTARPSARTLAETSIEVSQGRLSPFSYLSLSLSVCLLACLASCKTTATAVGYNF